MLFDLTCEKHFFLLLPGRRLYFEKKFLTEVVLGPRQLFVIIENGFGDFFDNRVITNLEFGTNRPSIIIIIPKTW